MALNMEQIKNLREMTGAGIADCKTALTESNGSIDKAVDFLRKKGLAKAAKKASRIAKEGNITSYIHGEGKIGVMVEVNCETDFVARNEDFQVLCRDVAMHIAAAAPLHVKREEVPAELIEREKEVLTTQAKESGKPEQFIEKIISGRMDKFFAETCLLEQSFVKNPDVTINDLLQESIAKMGENITIARFSRYVLGETAKENTEEEQES
ncbi:translation elongation factor Ts [bacterium]|nr:translation elongation factor Ts [bacterium]